MPIYDYNCSVCAHIVEVIHGIHEVGPRFCPSCGAEGSMRKGFTTPAVHFKGSGWAKKDRSAASSAGGSRSTKASTGDAPTGASSGTGSGDAASSTATPAAGPATITTTTTSASPSGGDD